MGPFDIIVNWPFKYFDELYIFGFVSSYINVIMAIAPRYSANEISKFACFQIFLHDTYIQYTKTTGQEEL